MSCDSGVCVTTRSSVPFTVFVSSKMYPQPPPRTSSAGGSVGSMVKSEPPAITTKRVAIKAESCRETPTESASMKLLLSPVEEDDTQLSPDELKKRRRNERDRKRSFAKRVRFMSVIMMSACDSRSLLTH